MNYAQLVSKARKRIRRIIANRLGLYILAGALFIAGSVVAMVRLYAPDAFPVCIQILLWSMASIVVITPFLTYWLAGCFVPSQTSVRAWLDNHFSCGGIMSAEEYFPEAINWERPDTVQKINNELKSLIPYRSGKALFVCLLSALFLTGAFFTPVPAVATPVNTQKEYLEKDIERIERKITLLKNENLLSEKQAEQLLETLMQLKDKTDKTDPINAFEALDAIENLLNKTTQDWRQEAQKDVQTAQDARDLAKAIKKDWERLNDAQKETAVQELKKLLDELKKENSQRTAKGYNDLKELDPKDLEKKPDSELDVDQSMLDISKMPNGEKLPDMSQLTPEQLEMLEQLLEQYQDNLDELLERLKQGDFDLPPLDIPEGDWDMESLKDFLEKNSQENNGDNLLLKWLKNKKSNQESTPLHFDGNPPDFNPDVDKFKPVTIPTHLTKQAIEQSQLKDIMRDPHSDPSKFKPKDMNDLQGEVIDPNDQDGGMGKTQMIYPMHRKSVEQYFDSGIAPTGAHRP